MGDIVSAVGGIIGAGDQADAASSAAEASAGASKYASDIQKQIYDQTRTDQTPWRVGGENALVQLLQGIGIDVPVSYAPAESRQAIYDRLKSQYTNSVPSNTSVGAMPNTLAGMMQQPADGQGYSIDTAGLNAAVDAELAKQQASAGQMRPRGDGFGGLSKQFGMADYQADPGYAFRMSEGEKALERSAAARGGLYSGRAMKDMARFSQGLAGEEYQNAFNRFNLNQSNKFNRLASLAGVGQTANQALATAGQNYADNVGSIGMNSAAVQGNAGMYGANARASAYGGIGKALGGFNLSSLGSIFGGGGGSSAGAYDASTWGNPGAAGNFGSPSDW